jgi:membrane protease YdiL (CAAX protease family)
MEPASVTNLMLLAVAGFGAALLATFIAMLMGFFKIPIKRYDEEQKVQGSAVLYAFIIFLAVKYIVSPAIFVVGYYLVGDGTFDPEVLMKSPRVQGWFSVILTVLLGLAYLFYFWVVAPKAGRAAWGKSGKALRSIAIGALSWLVVYPWVYGVSHLVEFFTWNFYQGPPLEQLAVEHVRAVMAFPVLFWLTALCVMIVVPIIEEVLFRGLLQTWLIGRTGMVSGVVLTSLAFSLLHFSSTQGVFNISILASLFVLSLFLGFLRVRQNSLYAPIALHATLNIVSLFIILIQEKVNEAFVGPAASFVGALGQ